jgi:DNA-binding cell septation regulator SpoVG
VSGLRVSEVRFAAAARAERSKGLLGFVSFVLADAVRLDSVVVRRTADDRIVLAFPLRHDRNGRQHELVYPINDAARDAITRAVVDALGLRAEAAP